MPRLRITGPDGRTVVLNAPDGATREQIQAKVDQIKAQWSRPADQPEPAAPSGPEVSGWESAGRGALQGLTFGFSDELYGAGAGAIDWLKGDGFNYAKNRDEVRAANARAQEANPGAYLAGEIGGAVALPFGAAGVAARGGSVGRGLARATGLAPEAAATTLPGRIAQGAGQGARAGATFGLGTSNADLTEGDIGGTLLETGKGAVGGALVGGALTPLVDAGAALVRRVTQPIRGYSNPRAVAAEKFGEAMARDMGSSGTPAEVAAALQRVNTRAAATADDPTMMLADIGGENTRRLMRQANNMPNENVQRFNSRLDQRQNFQAKRLERELQATLADGNEFYSTADSLAKARAANAGPAFEKAYNAPWNVKADDPLGIFITERPYVRRLIEKTAENVQGVTGRNVAELRPWELLHRVRMQIGKEIGRLKSGQGDSVANWDAKDLTLLKREFDAMVSKHNKEFGSALKQYSDESTLITSIKDGIDEFKKLQPEEIAAKIKTMSKDEADMYRLGAQRALVQDVRRGNATRDRTENVFSSPDMQKRLRAIFPDRASYRRFQRALVAEARKADLRKEVQGGSKTDRNLQTAAEAGAPMRAAVTAAQAATGRLEPVLNALGRAANRFSGLTPGSANAILEMGMRPAAQGLDPQIIAILQRYGLAPQQRSNFARGLGATVLGPLNEDEPLRGGIGPRYRDGALIP
jgi:hypothetical protein